LGAFVTSFEFGFAHVLAIEFDAINFVYETVENGVCKGAFSAAQRACFKVSDRIFGYLFIEDDRLPTPDFTLLVVVENSNP